MILHSADQNVSFREHMRGGNGTVRLQALLPELPANARLFSVLTLEPGTSIGVHRHDNETELFYFISGKACVTDDGEVYELSAGDAMATPSGHSHGVESIGNETLTILACIILD